MDYMKTVTLLIGCYYPSSLDEMAKELYIKKDVSLSNLLYERILDEDFFAISDEKNEVIAISSPSFGYYKQQCKRSRIDFNNLDRVHFVKYSTNKYVSHISKTNGILKGLKKIAKKFSTINIVISEAHLPYLLAVYKFKKKYYRLIKNITLIVPDLPKDVKRNRYNFLENLLKKIYVNKSNKLIKLVPTQYVCFTKEIAMVINQNKPTLISNGVVENSFSSLIKCDGFKCSKYNKL